MKPNTATFFMVTDRLALDLVSLLRENGFDLMPQILIAHRPDIQNKPSNYFNKIYDLEIAEKLDTTVSGGPSYVGTLESYEGRYKISVFFPEKRGKKLYGLVKNFDED